MKTDLNTIQEKLWAVLGFKFFLIIGIIGVKYLGLHFVFAIPVFICILVGIKFSLSTKVED